ncbi:MAG TPA: hypothetical protein VIO14_14545 [Dehalococcoidia bacterium]
MERRRPPQMPRPPRDGPLPDRLRRRPAPLSPGRAAAAGPFAPARRRTPAAGGPAVLFTLLTALSLLTFNAWLLTGPAGEPIQRRAVAELTEIDRYVSSQFQAIRAAAEASQEPAVAPPEYPVAVAIETERARAADPEELRDLILDRAAERVYREGLDAFSEEGGQARLLSPAGALRLTLGNVTRDRSLALLLATVGFVLLTVAAGARLARPLPGPQRTATLAGGLALGTCLALAVAGGAWLLLAAAAGGTDGVTGALLEIGRDAALLAARNTALAAVLALAGYAAARFLARRPVAPAAGG